MILHVLSGICCWRSRHTRLSMRWLLALLVTVSNVMPLLARCAYNPKVGVLEVQSEAAHRGAWECKDNLLPKPPQELSSESATEESVESSDSSSPELLDEEVTSHRTDGVSLMRRVGKSSSVKWNCTSSSNQRIVLSRVRSYCHATLTHGCGTVLRI